MSPPVFRARLVAILLLALYTASVWLLPYAQSTAATEAGLLTVTFLAVGQGDAILVETPDGHQLLVDGGPDSTVLGQLRTQLPRTDRTLEVVLGTHPDLDHVAGLVDVLDRYRVGTIITTEASGTSATAQAWRAAIFAEDAMVRYARAGAVYQLGASTTLHILSPSYDPSHLNSNTGSIVAQVRYGDTAFLLTGDAPQGIEQYLVGTIGTGLHSQVLKLGHHGSDTSSSDSFLTTVDPRFVVVSAGVANRYEHPATAVLARVAADTEAQIVSTQHGSVQFKSDGTHVWLTQ